MIFLYESSYSTEVDKSKLTADCSVITGLRPSFINIFFVRGFFLEIEEEEEEGQ